VLLVSELVANGVQHAGTKLEVSCRLARDVLEVRVTDRHPARMLPDPAIQAGDSDSERGRGLLLPMAIASAWGVTYQSGDKTVWFLLPVPGQPPASQDAAGWSGDSIIVADRPDGAPDDVMLEVGLSGGDAARRDLGKLDFDELVRRTVETARDAVSADAAYALIADEEGELRVRGVVGVAVPEALTVPPGRVVLSGGAGGGAQGGASDGGDDANAGSQLSVPFLVDGRVTGVLGVGAARREAFGEQDSRRLQQVADRVAMSLERLRLSELERIRRGRVAFLAEASELLSSTLDQRQAIALTAQLMVPRLAAWCTVFLADSPADSPADIPTSIPATSRADPAAELRPAYVWHEDESRIDELSSLLAEIAPPDLGRMMGSHGGSWSLAVPPGASAERARMAADAAWCFPLTARGRGLGAVVIGRPRGDRRWPDPPPRESLELAEDLTRRAALALDNARLYERQRTTSQALQHTLLPPELPDVPGMELAAEYEAAGEANEVGGDFYDVFPVDAPGSGVARWRFAIGDVCGTGPAAAAVTGLARHTLRILAVEGHSVTAVVERLNRLILREGTRGRFITLLHGEIRVPDTGPVAVSLVCAGHPLPLLLRAENAADAGVVGGGNAADAGVVGGGNAAADTTPCPAARPQILLGVEDDVTFEADEVLLYPGDALLTVTDGVTERRDDAGRLLDDDNGLAGVLAGCRGLSALAVASRIRRAVSDFGTESACDDMAILVLRARAVLPAPLHPAPPVPPSGLQPVAAAEDAVEHEHRDDHEAHRDGEPYSAAEVGIGHVHAVEPGDERRNGDDRRPARHLLADDVHPVALDGQVGLQDGGHQVPQAIGPLGGAQHVVIDVLVVGHQVLAHDVQVAAHQRVDHLAHGEDDPADQHKTLAQLEAAPLDRQDRRVLVEQLVLQRLDGVVQRPHRVKVPVHHVVKQPVQQVADAGVGEVRAGVPLVDDGPDVQSVVLADGDEGPLRDERGQLAEAQLSRRVVEAGAVRGQEQMSAVPVELRPFVRDDGVLDGHGVQPEFLLQHREVMAIGVAQVEPDEGGLIGGQVLADVLRRESLRRERAALVQASAGLALRRTAGAQGGGGDRVRVPAVEGHGRRPLGANRTAGRPEGAIGLRWHNRRRHRPSWARGGTFAPCVAKARLARPARGCRLTASRGGGRRGRGRSSR
jgi:serine phosphatase RsbU (regulator of sigma subunit)